MTLFDRILVLALAFPLMFSPAAAAAEDPQTTLSGWVWPVNPVQIVEPFHAPAHRYGPGHRGVDLAAPIETQVVAPAAGVIAFAGNVAGRPLLTIAHGGGLVTTLEPVRPLVAVGVLVEAGDVVATADAGGHAASGTIHFGVREDGEYINPLLLVAEVPRAVLLPCC